MLYRIGFSNTFHVTPLYYRFPRTLFLWYIFRRQCLMLQNQRNSIYFIYILSSPNEKKTTSQCYGMMTMDINHNFVIYMTKLNLFSFQRFQFTFLSIQYLSISKDHIAIHLCKFNGSRAGFWKQERLWCCLYFEKLRYYTRSGWRWWGSIILFWLLMFTYRKRKGWLASKIGNNYG